MTLERRQRCRIGMKFPAVGSDSRREIGTSGRATIERGKGIMKLLLTSAGISNTSIHNALVELLGKPIAESSALFIPTAIHANPNGATLAAQVIRGEIGDPFCDMGWKSLGVLE